ncbi:MAG: SDR family oxidoreductase [Pseudomonadota bacterium]
MRVLVLGAYGLIGHEIARSLIAGGHTVTGLARSAETGRALLPQAGWIGADLADMTTPKAWSPALKDVDAVVNAAGALQTGGRDNVRAVQQDAMGALYAACSEAGIRSFVQISAPGVTPDADTEFMRTKAVADGALQETDLDWVILRPGVVISHTAYGGTALLRMLAAFPLVQPMVMAGARLQTVHVGDVAAAVLSCLEDRSLARQTFDLVEPETHSLRDVLLAFRTWLGFGKPARVVELPAFFGRLVATGADLLGLAGWRSPLRSTALTVLADDVVGDPEPWQKASGHRLKTLSQTLDALPSSAQERLFARMHLLFPLLVCLMSVFWILSGAIGLVSEAAAVALIADEVGPSLARILLYGGSALDIAIGLGLVWRRTFRAAALASIALSLVYLVSGSLLTPGIWLDPLGPFVKILPVIGAGLCLLVVSGER